MELINSQFFGYLLPYHLLRCAHQQNDGCSRLQTSFRGLLKLYIQ